MRRTLWWALAAGAALAAANPAQGACRRQPGGAGSEARTLPDLLAVRPEPGGRSMAMIPPEDVAGVKALLAQRAAVDAVDVNGETALCLAAGYGYEATARLLLDHGADANHVSGGSPGTPLAIAAEMGYARIAALLIRHGADVSLPDAAGAAPLHYASQYGQTGIVRMLLDHGARVNARDGTGSTPLIEAAAYVHASTVRLLLRRGADVRARARSGESAVSAARSLGMPGSRRVVAILELAERHGRTVHGRKHSRQRARSRLARSMRGVPQRSP